MAMVQGSVYGAVNAIDRQGSHTWCTSASPRASKDAAVATAAFRVLDSLFSATHGATLQTAYDESLGTIPGREEEADQGIRAGEKAAAKMLAEGQDGRAVIGCTFGSGLPGVWQPLPTCSECRFATRARGGERQAVRGEERLAVSDGRPSANRRVLPTRTSSRRSRRLAP